MNERIAIEFLSVFDLPPLAFVDLAAELDCPFISCGLAPMGGPFNLNHHPHWSLRDDASLRRSMVQAMRANAVSISLADGFAIRPDREVTDLQADLALMKELAAARICSYCLEPDHPRALDQLAQLAEMATAAEVELILEFVPGLPIGDLNTAVAVIESIDSPVCKLMIDTMHLIRSGSTVADLQQLNPAQIGYAQICDVPITHDSLSYMEEATFERRVPGDGELPLQAILAALPEAIPVGIEIPQRSLALQGVSDVDRLAPCVAATRRLLVANGKV